MKLHKLTIEQKELIEGKEYAANSLFNPIQDIAGDWFISIEEVVFCTNDEFKWIKELPLMDFVPPINEKMT